MKKALLVIPTYNEVKNVTELINKIFALNNSLKNWRLEILIVDSNSPDGTANEVNKLQKKYESLHLLKTQKEGLGKAYVQGFKYGLLEIKPDVFFEMDADLSHDPQSIPVFLKKIDEGYDFVIGARYIKGGSIPKNWGLHRKLFSVLGNLIIRFGFMKLSIADWTSGYRAIKSWVIDDAKNYIDKYSGYVFQVALLDFALKNKASIGQVPINFEEREYGVSKINAVQFILQTLLYVFTKSSFIRYGIVGVLGAVIDFGLSFLIIEVFKIHQNLYWLATLISAEAAIIFNFLMNNFWSFAYKKLHHKFSVYLKSLAKFNIIAGGGLLIQASGIQTLTFIYGPRYWFIYKFFIIALIIIPYSYILYNKVVWKNK